MSDAAGVVLVSGSDSASLKASCARMPFDLPVEFVEPQELLNRLGGTSKPCVLILDAPAAAQLPPERSGDGWPIILVTLGQQEQEPVLDARTVHGFIRTAFDGEEVTRLLHACVNARIRLTREAMCAAVAVSGASLFMLLS